MPHDTHNPPAYPGPRNDEAGVFVGIHEGQTLRDHFAGQALNGICANRDLAAQGHFYNVSIDAYRFADAMLIERAKLIASNGNRDQLVLAAAQLRQNQRQIDADGAQVGVSRQALDEVLAWAKEMGL
jgi:hypothetical protein